MRDIESTQNKLEWYKDHLNAHEIYLSDFIKEHKLIIGALIPVSLYLAWKSNAPKHVVHALTKASGAALLLLKLSALK